MRLKGCISAPRPPQYRFSPPLAPRATKPNVTGKVAQLDNSALDHRVLQKLK